MGEVYLIQTDTTVGFVSKNLSRLNNIKDRDENRKTLLTVASLKDLKQNIRVPKNHKKLIRRSKKTTFIYSKDAFRVVSKNSIYKDLLKKEGKLYSTSANKTGEDFDQVWAEEMADIIIYQQNTFSQNKPSKLYKLGRDKFKVIR